MTPDQMLEFAQNYRRLWREHDLDGILALHSDDCELHVLGNEPVYGKDLIRAQFETLFRLVPDLHFQGRHLHTGPSHFVSEWTVTGTPAYHLDVFGVQGDATGRRLECDGTDILTVDDGLITSKHSYWDTAALRQQLEVSAPEQSRAA